MLTTVNADDPQIEAIVRLFQAEFDTGEIGGHLYAESLIQLLLIHLLRQYCAFSPKIQTDVEGYIWKFGKF